MEFRTLAVNGIVAELLGGGSIPIFGPTPTSLSVTAVLCKYKY